MSDTKNILEEIVAKRKELIGNTETENIKEKELEAKVGNNEKIKLSDVIEVTKKFVSGEISQEEMGEYGNNFSIRGYIPIMEKMSIMISIVSQHIYSVTEVMEIKTIELYKNIFFYIIMSAYGQVDCTDREDITYENYDLLYPIFSPFILSYCKDDYKLFMKMLHDSLNFYNIKDLCDSVNSVSAEALSDATKENKKLIDDLKNNKDLIKDLAEISDVNNPYTKRVVEELRKASLSDVTNSMKNKDGKESENNTDKE